MGVTKSRIEYISSANRTAGTNEDFYYQFSPWSTDDTYDYACVLYANIPISYYLVVSGQNTFTVNEPGARVITIPAGNYSVNSFVTVINSKLNTGAPSGWTYTVTFPSSLTGAQTGLFTYSVTGNSGTQPSFTFSNTLYDVMGFPNSSTPISFVGGSLTSSYVVDFTPETTLYLYSDMIETKDNNSENILQEFYASNAMPYSNIVYQCTAFDAYSKAMNKGKSNYYHFTLLNEYYQSISLNGQPFFMTLIFYKRDNILEMIKRYIKLKLSIS